MTIVTCLGFLDPGERTFRDNLIAALLRPDVSTFNAILQKLSPADRIFYTTTSYGFYPLEVAAIKGNLKAIKALEKVYREYLPHFPERVNHLQEQFRLASIAAAKSGHLDCFRYLLNMSFDFASSGDKKGILQRTIYNLFSNTIFLKKGPLGKFYAEMLSELVVKLAFYPKNVAAADGMLNIFAEFISSKLTVMKEKRQLIAEIKLALNNKLDSVGRSPYKKSGNAAIDKLFETDEKTLERDRKLVNEIADRVAQIYGKLKLNGVATNKTLQTVIKLEQEPINNSPPSTQKQTTAFFYHESTSNNFSESRLEATRITKENLARALKEEIQEKTPSR